MTITNQFNYSGLLYDKFIKSIHDESKLLIFNDSPYSSTDRLSLSLGVSLKLVRDQKYRIIKYIIPPMIENNMIDYLYDNHINKYMYLLNKALANIYIHYDKLIKDTSNPSGHIEVIQYYESIGSTYHNTILIINDAQRYTLNQLKSVLIRSDDSCKVILLGTTNKVYESIPTQCQSKYGFDKYIRYYSNNGNPDTRVAICTDDQDQSGWISASASLVQ